MLTIVFDSTGEIITNHTDTSTIKGELKFISAAEKEGQEIYKVDVEHNNTPLYRNTVETDLKETMMKLNKLLPILATNDIWHDDSIKNINDTLKLLRIDLDGAIAEIEVLKKGSVE